MRINYADIWSRDVNSCIIELKAIPELVKWIKDNDIHEERAIKYIAEQLIMKEQDWEADDVFMRMFNLYYTYHEDIPAPTEKQAITVEALITLLMQYPPTYKVITEGCDCHGKADGVETDDRFPESVIITRSN